MHLHICVCGFFFSTDTRAVLRTIPAYYEFYCLAADCRAAAHATPARFRTRRHAGLPAPLAGSSRSGRKINGMKGSAWLDAAWGLRFVRLSITTSGGQFPLPFNNA